MNFFLFGCGILVPPAGTELGPMAVKTSGPRPLDCQGIPQASCLLKCRRNTETSVHTIINYQSFIHSYPDSCRFLVFWVYTGLLCFPFPISMWTFLYNLINYNRVPLQFLVTYGKILKTTSLYGWPIDVLNPHPPVVFFPLISGLKEKSRRRRSHKRTVMWGSLD